MVDLGRERLAEAYYLDERDGDKGTVLGEFVHLGVPVEILVAKTLKSERQNLNIQTYYNYMPCLRYSVSLVNRGSISETRENYMSELLYQVPFGAFRNEAKVIKT